DSSVQVESPYKYRYAQNYTFFGYQTPYWGWDDWQREIDILALEGFNMLLSPVGVEAVLKQTFMDEGLSEGDFHQWLNAPAHLPWQFMGNTHSQGGQVYGANSTWFDRQVDLQKKILSRQSALGIKSVIPGFYGVIPKKLSEKYSGARVYHQGNWVGLPSISLLNAEEPAFQRIAKNFYDNYTETFDYLPKYISADPFHEGSPPAGWDISELGKATQNTMVEANPEAVWVLQHWIHTPHQEMLHSIDKSKAIVASLFNDTVNQWRPGEFGGTPWIRGTIENFGGKTGFSGKLVSLSHALPDDQKNAEHMIGMGSFPEGTHYNPIFYSLQAEMIWQSEKVDVGNWMTQYQRNRYGFSNKNSQLAAQLLRRDVYDPYKGSLGTLESMLTARPNDHIVTASTWGTRIKYFRPSHIKNALGLLLAESQRSNSDGFRFDLVDLSRQLMSDVARVLHVDMVAAANDGDLAKFSALSEQFLVLIDDLDRLLGSRSEFMLGTWLQQARAAGGTVEESDAYEKNFRLLVTAWEASQSLKDYSNREWSGLMGTFYKTRWQMWIAHKKQVIQGQNPQPINWHQFELNWSKSVAPFATQPVGDSKSLAREMYSKYAKFLDNSESKNGELIVTIENRYTGNYLVDTSNGPLTKDGVSPGHHASQWQVEQVNNTNRYRLVNRGTGKALHIENNTGKLESGSVPDTWWSSQWLLSVGNTSEPNTTGVPASYARLTNYWKQQVELNSEDKLEAVAATDVPDTYWSADWKLRLVPDYTGMARVATRGSYEAITDELPQLSSANLEHYSKSLSYWSADWNFEHVENGYYRITNRYTNRVIHIEQNNGYVNLSSSDQAPRTWWSAQWLIEQTDDGYYQLRNRYLPNYYIHTENQDGVAQSDKKVESYDIDPSNIRSHFLLQSASGKY
ncbi:hypothetical protein EKN09_25215, partial [Vibrio penaeicida]